MLSKHIDKFGEVFVEVGGFRGHLACQRRIAARSAPRSAESQPSAMALMCRCTVWCVSVMRRRLPNAEDMLAVQCKYDVQTTSINVSCPNGSIGKLMRHQIPLSGPTALVAPTRRSEAPAGPDAGPESSGKVPKAMKKVLRKAPDPGSTSSIAWGLVQLINDS